MKPENLMVSQLFHLKVIDFGTALFFNDKLLPSDLKQQIMSLRAKFSGDIEVEDTRSRQGTFVGSAEYASPELLEFGSSGPEADFWSLGCMIYYMYTGKTPFIADNVYLIFSNVKALKIDFPAVRRTSRYHSANYELPRTLSSGSLIVWLQQSASPSMR